MVDIVNLFNKRISARGGIKYPLKVRKIFHIYKPFGIYQSKIIEGIEYPTDDCIDKDIEHYLNEFYSKSKNWKKNSQIIICIMDQNKDDDIVLMFCVLKTGKDSYETIWLS